MITLGRHSYHGSIDFEDRACIVTVGNFTSIAGGLRIIAGDSEHPPTNFPKCVSSFPLAVKLGADYLPCGPRGNGEVHIGSDVWIGSHVTILGGAKINDGAIVGAGAVVAHDVPPYAVVAGNPAVVLKYRFTVDEIAHLEDLRWWEWPDEKIKEAAPHMKDVAGFIRKYSMHLKESAD